MIRFPPVDAALEGFRVTRERPLAVLGWGGVLMAVNLAGQAWLVGSGALTRIAALPPADAVAPDAAAGALSGLAPTLAILFVVGLAVNVLLYTAVLRSVLEPGQARLAYLRVGMDEVRQFALALIIAIAWFLYAVVVEVASQAISAAASSLPGPLGGLLKAAVFVAVVIAFLYPVVRLSLAPAMTFAEQRVSLLRSWALTEGQFWALFGAYVLAAVLAVLVMLLAVLIFGAVAAVGGLATHGGFDIVAAAAQKGDMTLARLFSPTGLALMAINAVCSTLAFAIIMAVGPAAFRHLSGRAGAPAR